MLESLTRLYNDLFHGDVKRDNRKRDYGSLDEIKNHHRIRTKLRTDDFNNRIHKNRIYRSRNMRGRRNMKIESKAYVNKRGNVSSNPDRRKGNVGRLSKIVKSLKSIFFNEQENLVNMKIACENFQISPSASMRNQYNDEYKLREKIQRSSAFRKKLSDLKYDKRQLAKLRSSNTDIRGRARDLKSLDVDKTSLNDKIYLLTRENDRLKRELLQRESELSILRKELRFTKENERLHRKDDILDLLSAESNVIDKIYDKKLNDRNIVSGLHDDVSGSNSVNKYNSINNIGEDYNSKIKEDNILDNLKQNSNLTGSKYASGSIDDYDFNIIEERSRSFSPVRIDYSRYSR